MLKIGVHVSIAGKIYNSVERAEKLGCNTMQIFSRSPRQWRKSSVSKEDAEIFKKKVKKAKISPVVIHVPYLLNLASARRGFHKITIREFIADLVEAGSLGADYLVTHMGSYKGTTEAGGLLRVVNALNKILKETKGVKTLVLLENTSGSGRWLGYNFSHLKFIIERLNMPERIGLCLDTAHAWAAGYKINTVIGLNSMLREIEQEVGLSRLKVIHLNDTQEELGSKIDHHCDIGEGKIGKKGFGFILNHPKLKDLPFIMETPNKGEDGAQENLKLVKKLHKDEL